VPRTSPRPARPRVVLRLEELEPRSLLSAGPLAGWAAVPLSQAPLPVAAPTAGSGYFAFTPAQIRHAYGFDQLPLDGAGQTIAIVDAYDDPNIAWDLQTFDRAVGLPDPPSFQKVKLGAPAFNPAWAGEIALDVEWAHAIAPGAKILLVEANSAGGWDLLSAVDYARRMPGVSVVSMSWGSGEYYYEGYFDGYFATPYGHAPVAFVASAGDTGAWYGASWPAVSPNVLAVGGTSLYLDASGNYYVEAAWSLGGAGLSPYLLQPAYQRGFQPWWVRSIPDVSYDANPATGFYVYDSAPNVYGQTGWFAYGGTSAGAPQWAALVALADEGRAWLGKAPLGNLGPAVYALPSYDFHDITLGANPWPAGPGFDYATGRGTPYADRVVWGLAYTGSAVFFSNTGYPATAGVVVGYAAAEAGRDPALLTAPVGAAGPAAFRPFEVTTALAQPAAPRAEPAHPAADDTLWARATLFGEARSWRPGATQTEALCAELARRLGRARAEDADDDTPDGGDADATPDTGAAAAAAYNPS
jgi:hypothetical protein